MSVLVMLSCDKDVGEGTCPTKAFGRPGEGIDATVARAVSAGWGARAHAAGRHLPPHLFCPWHANASHGGTGPL